MLCNPDAAQLSEGNQNWLTTAWCCAGDTKLKPDPSMRSQSLADSLGIRGKPDAGAKSQTYAESLGLRGKPDSSAPSQTLAESLGLRIRPAANARPQSLADSLGLRWGCRQLSALSSLSVAGPVQQVSGDGRATLAARQARPC